MAPSAMLALTLAHLLIAFTCGQMSSTSPESCPVTQTQQLTVNGCPIFVHDVSGTKDFVIEPLMCITQNLSNLLLQLDPLTQKIFVSVPVTLRDDAMLAQIKNQLQHLSPNSVKFAPVSKISVSTDASSKCAQAMVFLWRPNEPVGYLRLGGLGDSANFGIFLENSKDSIFDAINGVTATADIEVGTTLTELKYKLMVQNQNFFYPEFYGSKFEYESNCGNLQFLRSVIVGKCIAQVYQRNGGNGIFYIEPMLCPENSAIKNSMMYDYNRYMYYLKLDVVLQDDITLNAVQRELANLSPSSVSFLQLWRIEIAFSSLLRDRFDVNPLMVSGDWRSGQVRVYCKTEDDCKRLRSNIVENPLSFWGHVNFDLTSHIPISQCTVRSAGLFNNIMLTEMPSIGQIQYNTRDIAAKLNLIDKYQKKVVDGKLYVIIQQRRSRNVSFARTWNEYEAGFGDAENFWIGLSTIHLLSINGTTLRMEANGGGLYWEFAEFKVGDASTNYKVTHRELIANRTIEGESKYKWHYLNGMQFSTIDRKNDRRVYGSCTSNCADCGEGGWWYNTCNPEDEDLPNTVFGWSVMLNVRRGMWGHNVQELRLMLQI